VGNRGSTLAAALALAFLIFAVTSICLARVASTYAEAGARHNQASALFLAEAGIRNAGHALVNNANYAGEKGTRLTTGCFDVSVTRGSGGYIVTSTGHVDSALKIHPRKTVRATISITGRSFRISDWRENQ
jgi:Tfp pilus assembly protein PilX